jgi:hypothetical protein
MSLRDVPRQVGSIDRISEFQWFDMLSKTVKYEREMKPRLVLSAS